MQKKLDVQEIEKKIYRQYFEDGILDMAIGFGFMAAGLFVEFDLYSLIGAFLGLLLIFPAFKKKFTARRIGLVNFNEARLDRTKLLFTFSLIAGIVLLVVTIFNGTGADTAVGIWVSQNMMWVLAISMMLVALVLGWVLSFYRLMGYGVVLCIAIGGSQYFGSFPWNLFFTGLFMFLVGTMCLLRFMKRYPLHSEGEADEN